MAFVRDREALDRASATYAPDQLGETQYMTPEGYLLCEGVRLARTGPMLYSHAEMPEIEPAPSGAMIVVQRDADVLFAPETMLSFAGKPVTNDHPSEMVSGDSYNDVAVGTTLNPRRGEGVNIDYLIGDLLIWDADTIALIRSKKKLEISLGYDAEVEQVTPGLGRQTEVRGNHTALVNRARGGPSLSIQDNLEEPDMATRTTRKILDGIRKAFKAKDEAALETALGNAAEAMDDDADGSGADPQTIVIKLETPAAAPADPDPANPDPVLDDDPNEARFTAIESALADIAAAVKKLSEGSAPPADPDPVTDEDPDASEAEEEKKEAEKTAVADSIAKAEILSPGIRLPKMDAASPATGATLTTLRRAALTGALALDASKASVTAVLGGQDIAKLRPSQVKVVFDAAAAIQTAHNNAPRQQPGVIPQGRMTAGKLQERIVERRKANR